MSSFWQDESRWIYRLVWREFPTLSQDDESDIILLQLRIVSEMGLFRGSDLPQHPVKVGVFGDGSLVKGTLDHRGKCSLSIPSMMFHDVIKRGSTLTVKAIECDCCFCSQILPICLSQGHFDENAPMGRCFELTGCPHKSLLIDEYWDEGIPGKIWDGALVLLRYLEQIYLPSMLLLPSDALQIIDLSTGTGLLGLYCHLYLLERHRVTTWLTDLPEYLGLIKHNCKINDITYSGVKVMPLSWGSHENVEALGLSGNVPTLILASDLVYASDLHEKLIDCLLSLSKKSYPNSTKILLSFRMRALSAEDKDKLMGLLGDSKITCTPVEFNESVEIYECNI